ncbi:MAG: Fic family protein [bacterium]
MYSPKYTITNSILKNVGTIDSAREVISHAPLVPAWERRFQTEARLKIIHHGTHLEGNDLNLEEVEEILSPSPGSDLKGRAQPADSKAGRSDPIGTPPARDRDIREVINYRAVMDYLDTLVPKGSDLEGSAQPERSEGRSDPKGYIVLSPHLLSEVHKLTVAGLLPDDEAGHYRSVKVVIRNTETHEISFRPPPPLDVPFLIDDLFAWLECDEGKAVHPLLRAGILHYELVRIHPFTDGNGRTARAIALLLLFLEGYQVKKFFALEEYYDSHPEEYYAALQSVSSSGELTSWLEYFTLGIAIEFNRIKTLVQKLSLDLHLKTTLGGRQITLSTRQIKLVEYIERHGQISMGSVRDLLPDVSEDTILRDLRDLVSKNLLTKKGSTKGTKYYLKSN